MTEHERQTWVYVGPTVAGWYATVYSWDTDEGTFCGSHYWDGNRWSDKLLPIFGWSPIALETETEARAWADDHDLGF